MDSLRTEPAGLIAHSRSPFSKQSLLGNVDFYDGLGNPTRGSLSATSGRFWPIQRLTAPARRLRANYGLANGLSNPWFYRPDLGARRALKNP